MTVRDEAAPPAFNGSFRPIADDRSMIEHPDKMFTGQITHSRDAVGAFL